MRAAHLLALATIFALVLAFLAAPEARGGDDFDALLDRLFDADPGVRAAAREEVADLGAAALPGLLDRVEALLAGGEVLDLYDVRDLTTDGITTERIAEHLRERAGLAEAAVRTKGEGLLVVRAPALAQTRVKGLLDELREWTRGAFTVSVRILSDTPADAAPVRLLSEAEVRAFLERHGRNVVTSPRITLAAGQQGNLSVLNETSYVADYEITETNDSSIADPIVQTLTEGLILDLVVEPEGDNARVTTKATFAEVQRPIESFRTTVGGHEVEIQLPEVRITERKAVLRVPLGSTVRLAGEGRAWLLTVTRVDPATLLSRPGEEIDLVPGGK